MSLPESTQTRSMPVVVGWLVHFFTDWLLTQATDCGVRVVADAGQYMYLGCFEDSATTPDVSGPRVTLPELTVDKCATQCRSSGYPYAALQMGTMCSCGNEYGTLGPSIRTLTWLTVQLWYQ